MNTIKAGTRVAVVEGFNEYHFGTLLNDIEKHTREVQVKLDSGVIVTKHAHDVVLDD